MSDDRTLRRIDWRELCPWLLILRTFRLAVGARVLTLMLVALVASAAGWNLIGWMFSGSSDPTLQNWIREDSRWPIMSYLPSTTADNSGILDEAILTVSNARLKQSPVIATWQGLSQPFVRIFSIQVSFVQLAYLILGCLWSLAVWALLGGAVTRIAAVALAREDRLSLFGAIGFARRKWFSFVAGPLFPFVGVLMAVIPLFLLGLLLLAKFFLVLTVILYPLVLIAGFFLAVVTIGLLLGWPLMWGTISSEGTDAFDALSRSYNYLRERPLYYFGYTVFAALFGLVCVVLVSLFATAIVYLAYWGLSWGFTDENLRLLQTPGDSWFMQFGGSVIGFFNGCVRALVSAFVAGYFWTAMTAVYLLMRLRVDATELDEVYMPDEEQAYGMPPLTTDAAGVPQVVDTPPPA